MNCFNCGASVTGEHKNCPFCGQSMQIVPDYNFLDDDNINVIMEESALSEAEKNEEKEAANRIRRQKQQAREKERQRKSRPVSVSGACLHFAGDLPADFVYRLHLLYQLQYVPPDGF